MFLLKPSDPKKGGVFFDWLQPLLFSSLLLLVREELEELKSILMRHDKHLRQSTPLTCEDVDLNGIASVHAFF